MKTASVRLVLGMGLAWSVLAQAQVADSVQARLSLQTPRQGLSVRVDGRVVGKTPLDDLALSPGRHAVSVSSPDSLDWLSKPFVRDILALPGSVYVLRVEFDRHLWVTSDPPGARVTVRGAALGQTPLAVTLPEEGDTDLILDRPGYATATLQAPDHSGSVHGILFPLTAQVPFTIRHPKLHTSRLIWGTALVVALGAAGYWCQSQADKAYNDYLVTGHPDRMDAAFRRSQTYDRWSGALYVAGEAGLAVTLYFSLKGLWR